MPAWTGWDEDAVRHRDATEMPGTVTMGFTPINATSMRSTGARRSSSLTQDTVRAIASHQPGAKSVASAYLGRNDDDQGGLSNSTLRDKAPSVRGKKRKNASNAGRAAKRVQSGNVSDGMPTTKSRSHAILDPKPKRRSNRITKASLEPNGLSTSSTVDHSSLAPSTTQIADQTNEDAAMDGTVQPTVYAPTTSMDMVRSSAPTTSMDALRASSEQGYVLYDAAISPAASQDQIVVSQPWLDHGVFSRQNDSRQHGLSIVKQPTLTRVEDENDMYTLIDSLSEDEYTQSSNQKSHRHGSGCSRLGSERSKPRKTLTSGAYLPTPANSDPAAETSVFEESYKALSDAVGSRDEAPFMFLSDDDDERLIELAKRVEQTKKQLTTPSRDRRKNVREVASDETYGGALLSKADRQLHGEYERRRLPLSAATDSYQTSPNQAIAMVSSPSSAPHFPRPFQTAHPSSALPTTPSSAPASASAKL